MSTPARIRPKRIPDFVDLVSSEDEVPAGPSRLPLAPKRAILTPRKNAKTTPSIKQATIPTVKHVKPIIVVSDDEEDTNDRDVKPAIRAKSTRPAKPPVAKASARKEVHVKQEMAQTNDDPGMRKKTERVCGSSARPAKQHSLSAREVDIKPHLSQLPASDPHSAQDTSVSTTYRTPPKNKSDDEDEDEFPMTRTPWRSRRKVVIHSDSEDDMPPRQTTLRDSPLTGMDRLRLWDDAESEEEADSEPEEAERDYDLDKHYDTSLGSLRDFIVDDSDESGSEARSVKLEDDEEEEEEEAVMSEGYISSGSSTGARQRPIVVADSEDEDETDHAILHHTPTRRPVALPDFSRLTIDEYPVDSDSDSESSVTNGPTTKSRKAPKTPNIRRIEKDWKVERERIASSIFRELNKKVFEGKLGDCAIEWNKRLLTTAGQAKSSRTPQSDGSKKQTVKIVLSEKVLTGEEQILNTVAHEMCHVACWIISNEYKNPHGKIFKSWGRKVMRARPDLEVTTTHSYTIEFKYTWKCSNETCPVVYRRHSKSIDIEKHGCYRCANRLIPQFETKTSNPFQTYLKANMATAKAAMPGASHGDVMRYLSRQWQEEQGTLVRSLPGSSLQQP